MWEDTWLLDLKNQHLSIRSVISLPIITCLRNHLPLHITAVDSPSPASKSSNNPRGWTWAITIKLEDNLQTLLFLFPLGHGTWRVFRYPVGSIARQDQPSFWVGLSGLFQFLGRSFLAVGPEDLLPIFSVMLLCLDTPCATFCQNISWAGCSPCW